jgi:hypothetical protein
MKNRNSQQRLIIGTFILIIGVIAMIGNLNIFDTRQILQFWPTIFIVLGTLKITQSRNRSSMTIGFGLIIWGSILTLNHLELIHVEIRELWPLLLIFFGISTIAKTTDQTNHSGLLGLAEGGADIDRKIDITAIMSGNKSSNTSQNFVGGDITAIMGGVELDLRGASIEGDAVLNVWATWGGIEIKVPADWLIINNGFGIMGGLEDKSVPAMDAKKRLIITGYAIMGGVQIKN